MHTHSHTHTHTRANNVAVLRTEYTLNKDAFQSGGHVTMVISSAGASQSVTTAMMLTCLTQNALLPESSAA